MSQNVNLPSSVDNNQWLQCGARLAEQSVPHTLPVCRYQRVFFRYIRPVTLCTCQFKFEAVIQGASDMSADIWILLAVKMQRKVEVIELSHKQYTPG